jgi:hypothetical protein
MLGMAECNLYGLNKEVLLYQYENYPEMRMSICRKCYGDLHITVHFHPFGFGDSVKRNFYRERHEMLVEEGLIE